MQSSQSPLPSLRQTIRLAILTSCLVGMQAFAGHSRSQAAPEAVTSAQQEDIHLPGSANDLVREIVQNELKQNDSKDHYIYRLRKETSSGSQTKEVVDTDDGPIARLLAVNDRPLTAAERHKDDERLQKLLTDPQAQQKHRKSQLEDAERVKKMLRSMPDAFLYEYDGAEDSKFGKLVRLRFTPNPTFTPPNHETQIYRGMEGTMLVAAAPRRLVKMDATLTRDVSFGWGIFGHLDRGGHFSAEQSEVGNNDWETTGLKVDFTGRVMLFKRLNIHENETSSDFQPAPSNLTLEEGVELLRKQNPVVAEKKVDQPSGSK